MSVNTYSNGQSSVDSSKSKSAPSSQSDKAEGIHSFKDLVKMGGLDEQFENLMNEVKELRSNIQKLTKQGGEYFKSHPYQLIIGASAVGLVAGFLLFKRR